MGYWGEHIMDGDGPLDFRAVLFEKIGLREGADVKFIADRLTFVQDELLAYCLEESKKNDITQEPVLILGVMMVNNGASINQKVMQAILHACDNDHLTKEDIERKIYIKEFRSILATYDNKTPTKERIDRSVKFLVSNDLYGGPNKKGRLSQKVAFMALHHIHKELNGKPWYGRATLMYGSNGYGILIGSDFDGFPEGWNDPIMKSPDLFDIPLYFIPQFELARSRWDEAKYPLAEPDTA